MMAKKQQQQKADSLPLVAIDLGSSGVRAIAAECVGEDNRILSGSACCVMQEMQSVVRATLDAVNRNLEKRLRMM